MIASPPACHRRSEKEEGQWQEQYGSWFCPFYFGQLYFSILECPFGSFSNFLILCTVSHFFIYFEDIFLYDFSIDIYHLISVSESSWGQSPLIVFSLEEVLAKFFPSPHWSWVQNPSVPYLISPFQSVTFWTFEIFLMWHRGGAGEEPGASSTTYDLGDPEQVSRPFCASVSSYIKWG